MLQVLSDEPVDHTAVETGVNGLRLGIPSYFFDGVEPAIVETVQRAVSALQSAGATIVELDLPA